MLPGSQEKANDEFDRPWVCSLTAQQNRGFTAEPRALNFDPMEAQDLFKDISIGDRLRGAFMSQFVGDAAALGTHWIYNLTELQRLYPSGISGFEAPKEGHCHFGKEPGDQTHYGDSALVFLELGKQWKRRCTTSRWVLGFALSLETAETRSLQGADRASARMTQNPKLKTLPPVAPE